MLMIKNTDDNKPDRIRIGLALCLLLIVSSVWYHSFKLARLCFVFTA